MTTTTTTNHKLLSSNYEKPEWSSLPVYDYSLEVIKNGVIIDEILLKNQESFLIGRQGDIVDILLEHESISRKHAILNFHKDGKLYLKDIGSAQGTIINKKMIEKNEFYCLEVGDVIKFGCSTRIYVVKGPETLQPEEVESEELRVLRNRAIERAERQNEVKKNKQQAEEEEGGGVSWGMDFDDPAAEEEEQDQNTGQGSRKLQQQQEEQDDDRFRNPERFAKDLKRTFLPDYLRKDEHYDQKYGEKYQAPIEDSEVHSEKDKQSLEKIRKKEIKIQNMQEEIRRIYLKEQNQEDGLTQGQLQAIQRNEKAIEQLQNEIDQMVQNIRSKNQSKPIGGVGGVKGKRRRRRDGDEDYDDYDDDDYEEDDGDLDNQDNEHFLDTSYQNADISTNWRLKKKLQKVNHTITHSSAAATAAATAAAAATNRHSRSTISTTAATTTLDYHQIKAEITDLTARRQKTEDKLQQLQSILNAQQQQQQQQPLPSQQQSFDDEVDAIIQQDVSQEIKQKIKLFSQEKAEYDLKLQNLEKLLKIVTPALKSLVEKEDPVVLAHRIAEKEKKHIDDATTAQLVGSIGESSSHTTADDKKDNDNDQSTLKNNQKETSVFGSDERNDHLKSLEEFQKFVEQEKELEKKKRQEEGTESSNSKTKHPSEKKDHQNNNNNNSSKTAAPAPKVKGPSLPAKPATIPTKPLSSDPNMLEGGDYVWVPPKKQTGDGKTSLNDKFGY